MSKFASKSSEFNLFSFCIEAGTPPINLFFPRLREDKLDKFPMSEGISMDKEFLPKSNSSNSLKCKIEEGMPFENLLLLSDTDSCYNFVFTLGGPYFFYNAVSPHRLKSRHYYSHKSNSNGSCQIWGVKCHFATLNSVLTPLNSDFAPMVGAKMG